MLSIILCQLIKFMLDLLLFVRGARIGYEVKYTDAPKVTASQRRALSLLGLESLTIVVPGDAAYPLDERIRAPARSHARNVFSSSTVVASGLSTNTGRPASTNGRARRT